jgi:putative GTP pyrophosphokinase
MFELDEIESLSYKSKLGRSLKAPLTSFNYDDLIEDIDQGLIFYDNLQNEGYLDFLLDYGTSYRVKSIQSCIHKCDRFWGKRSVENCFNDLLGIRVIIEDWDELWYPSGVAVADMRNGKWVDDGYRAVHLYYQISHDYYPIEVQVNTYYDRIFNQYLHDYVYKTHDPAIGRYMKECYDAGYIRNEEDFAQILYEEFGI